MSRRAREHFSEDLIRLIERYRQEYRVSDCEFVGVLEFTKQGIILECFNVATIVEVEEDDDAGDACPADPEP